MKILRIVAAIIFLASFILKFGSFRFGLTLIVAAVAVSIIFFWGRVEQVYQWFESRFMRNLNERELLEMQKETKAPQPALAPWDAHIAKVTIPQEATFVGKSLLDLAIRERFGVTIASIERGKSRMMAPSPHTPIFPSDTLGVIGTDDQLENFTRFIQGSCPNESEEAKDTTVSLLHFVLTKESPLVGKTIRESSLREKTSGLVVGIEREGERMLNPHSQIIFQEGDLVWIVGEKEKVEALH